MADSKLPEFEPPQACINRILKSVMPDNVQITKDSRAAFARAAGIFIFYLTHCANDISKEKKRSTISHQDVIGALKELDMEEFIPQLETFMKEYNSGEPAAKQRKLNPAQTTEKSSDDRVEDEDDENDIHKDEGELDALIQEQDDVSDDEVEEDKDEIEE